MTDNESKPKEPVYTYYELKLNFNEVEDAFYFRIENKENSGNLELIAKSMELLLNKCITNYEFSKISEEIYKQKKDLGLLETDLSGHVNV